jgi:Holliday junction resolvase
VAEKYWKAQENRIRKLLEKRGWVALRQPGSGALKQIEFKGDVLASYGCTDLAIDHKSTKGEKSVSIKREDLQKHIGYAQEMADFGIITFGYFQKQDLYAVIPLEELLSLFEDRERLVSRLEARFD